LKREWGRHDPFDTLVAACQRDRRHGHDSDGRSRHDGAPSSGTYFHGPTNDPNAFYNPAKDPNAVYYGGTYAGSDPDPNIRAALIREFGRQMRN
jgi:hypothetical protein